MANPRSSACSSPLGRPDSQVLPGLPQYGNPMITLQWLQQTITSSPTYDKFQQYFVVLVSTLGIMPTKKTLEDCFPPKDSCIEDQCKILWAVHKAASSQNPDTPWHLAGNPAEVWPALLGSMAASAGGPVFAPIDIDTIQGQLKQLGWACDLESAFGYRRHLLPMLPHDLITERRLLEASDVALWETFACAYQIWNDVVDLETIYLIACNARRSLLRPWNRTVNAQLRFHRISQQFGPATSEKHMLAHLVAAFSIQASLFDAEEVSDPPGLPIDFSQESRNMLSEAVRSYASYTEQGHILDDIARFVPELEMPLGHRGPAWVAFWQQHDPGWMPFPPVMCEPLQSPQAFLRDPERTPSPRMSYETVRLSDQSTCTRKLPQIAWTCKPAQPPVGMVYVSGDSGGLPQAQSVGRRRGGLVEWVRLWGWSEFWMC